MMEAPRQKMPAGLRWELELFGPVERRIRASTFEPPDYLDRSTSISEVVRLGRTVQKYSGLSYQLLHEVRWNIARQVVGDVPTGLLQIYIALDTSLDVWHGVDAFFSWRNVILTLDASVRPKERGLKADLLITPVNMKGRGMINTGQRIATALIFRAGVNRLANKSSASY